ncbi:predicted protein [Thalassiosira pseudonana CCMP1335]|uniref:Uncharacterized protein n=1 Tax=Thalassiosira pseudonana TaxID=35128 RepID=B8BY11_THAPS|nr:predicted protein [Thalassiosira pseudonana CCMP1335]EED94297.1 predicted protein [Thalassiosira pseudonana CCMP1335]
MHVIRTRISSFRIIMLKPAFASTVILNLSFLCLRGIVGDIHNDQYSSYASSRNLQIVNSTSADGLICHIPLSTSPIAQTTGSFGIVFAIESDAADGVGPLITSFGIHVDSGSMQSTNGKFAYEVYALKQAGYYADTNRDFTSTLVFDYRGELDQWNLIAEGQILETDLTTDVTTLSVQQADYFAIPFENFQPTRIPPNGGQQSFYVTLKANGLQYADPSSGLALNQQPSMSMVPSTSPTVVESYSPSESPTLSFPPSAVPTSMDSEVPSSAPSAAYVEEVRSGLVLSLGLDECTYDENGKPTELSEEEKSGVAATVQKTAAADAAAKDVTNVQVEVTGVGVVGCRRRLSGDDRRLPTASSAIDFSMVITGEYRPIRRPGSSGPPPPASMDLGAIAEDSINRDPDKFVKDLQARAPADSALNQAAGVEVQAVEAPPKGAPAVMLTRRPTLSPTEPVVAMIIIEEGEEKSSVLLICIVIVGGTIVLLLAFLLFRHAERKAAKKRRKKLERARSEKESDALAKLENDKNAWQLAYNGSDIKQVVHPGAHNMRYSDGAPPHHQYPPPPMYHNGAPNQYGYQQDPLMHPNQSAYHHHPSSILDGYDTQME